MAAPGTTSRIESGQEKNQSQSWTTCSPSLTRSPPAAAAAVPVGTAAAAAATAVAAAAAAAAAAEAAEAVAAAIAVARSVLRKKRPARVRGPLRDEAGWYWWVDRCSPWALRRGRPDGSRRSSAVYGATTSSLASSAFAGLGERGTWTFETTTSMRLAIRECHSRSAATGVSGCRCRVLCTPRSALPPPPTHTHTHTGIRSEIPRVSRLQNTSNGTRARARIAVNARHFL